jgi:hypothetical protein
MRILKTLFYYKPQIGWTILLAVIWCIYTYLKGVILPIDATAAYSPWADGLIKYNFNVIELADNIQHRASLVFYFLWLVIVAVSKILLGENWGAGVVILNLFAAIAVAILLFKASWAITRKPICTVFTGLFLVLCYDFHLWIPFALSDIIFTTICFSVFYLVLTFFQKPEEPLGRFVGIIVLFGIAFLFRPAWPPLFLFIIFFLSILFFSLRELDSNGRHSFIVRLTLLTGILFPAIVVLHSYIMQHPENWPFVFFGDFISYVAGDYRKGIVLYGRSETFHFPPINIWEYSLISIHKIFIFFAFDIKGHSFKHTLVNYIFFTPIYGLSIFAITQLFKKEEGPSSSSWWSIFLCATYIFIFAFFHSLNQIDFDFRYRLPCTLPLILLATLGLNELINNPPKYFLLFKEKFS